MIDEGKIKEVIFHYEVCIYSTLGGVVKWYYLLQKNSFIQNLKILSKI